MLSGCGFCKPAPQKFGQKYFIATYKMISNDADSSEFYSVYCDGTRYVRFPARAGNKISENLFVIKDYGKKATYFANKIAHIYFNQELMNPEFPTPFVMPAFLDESSIQRLPFCFFPGKYNGGRL